MDNILVGDIVLVRESTDSKNRLKRSLVLCEGPLIHVGLRTERTWFLRTIDSKTFSYEYFWEPESNLVPVDFD